MAFASPSAVAGLRRALDGIRRERLERFEPLIGDLMESQEGKSLLAMLVDEYYQQTLHPAPEVEVEAQPEQKDKAKSRRRGRRRRRR